MLKRTACAVLLALGLALGAGATGARAESRADVWALLKAGGQVVLMRHGATEGDADPPGSKLGDCSTQRNLSEVGRIDARLVGEAFRKHGIAVGRVRSSPWCRCLDTARIAFGKAEVWADLETLGAEGSKERAQRERRLRKALGTRPKQGNTILISHTYVITPLTGLSPMAAEFIVLTPQPDGSFRIAGRVATSELVR